MPERERVEKEFTKRILKQKSRKTSKFVRDLYLMTCKDIYCQDKCPSTRKNAKTQWKRSFTKKRKEKLMKRGAKSGCRDLIKEHPTYYKDI